MSRARHVMRPATMSAITDAAIAALAERADTSMSAIALRAGVGRATLHRHFKSREDLLNAIGHRCIEEMNAAVMARVATEPSSIGQLAGMFEAAIPLGDRYAFLAHFRGDESLAAAYRRQLLWLRALIADLRKDGHLAADVPDSWVLAQIDQLIWTAWAELSRGHVTPREASSLALRTLLDGLGGAMEEGAKR